ncbi:antibiotic biosynthesis monooxygenase family protein [Nitritalea halalkaliphila LW7]|uniref:Antibiotic biosynthesis monooxygenase family protein n=1 Tax=Nitritalea halalkaliphila LW7 TaxID=1189621 RepID=I5C9R7_9BACT|nr:antibiotic biosynthesis monooxygenase family protein [Nitritalea halalkaliphila LW7]
MIFTSVLEEHREGYAEMAELMLALAQEQQGFLGLESA